MLDTAELLFVARDQNGPLGDTQQQYHKLRTSRTTSVGTGFGPEPEPEPEPEPCDFPEPEPEPEP